MLYGGSENTQSAASGPMSRWTSATTVASPTRSLWSPRFQRSAACDTGVSATSGTESSSVRPSAASSAASRRASSSSSKPRMSRLKSSSRSAPNSSANISSSQAGIQRQAIIRYHQGAPLGFRQMLQHNDRDFTHFELSGRQQPRMARDNHPVGAHQNRVDESELGDRGSHLRHLSLAVRARISGVRHQPVDRPLLDFQI